MMESHSVNAVGTSTSSFKSIFVEWLIERKEFIVPFFVLFAMVDPLITYVGVNAFDIDEGNFIVSIIIKWENGWLIWLALKTVFGLVGTMFMFSAYYTIRTEELTDTEKKKAIMFEYGGWSFLLCLFFIIILHWVITIIFG